HQQARRRYRLDQRTQGLPAPHGGRRQAAELDPGRVPQQGSHDPVSNIPPVLKRGAESSRLYFSCERIIVSIILNRVSALSACGWLAGISTAWPAFVTMGFPQTVISAWPSSTCASASKGAVCSLKPWPSSKANSVIVAAGCWISVRLTTAPS